MPTSIDDPPRWRGGPPDSFPVTQDRARLAQARTLAGWITLIAEERGLDEQGVAAATDLAVEDVHALLGGTRFTLSLSTLDQALRRLEGRAH